MMMRMIQTIMMIFISAATIISLEQTTTVAQDHKPSIAQT